MQSTCDVFLVRAPNMPSHTPKLLRLYIRCGAFLYFCCTPFTLVHKTTKCKFHVMSRKAHPISLYWWMIEWSNLDLKFLGNMFQMYHLRILTKKKKLQFLLLAFVSYLQFYINSLEIMRAYSYFSYVQWLENIDWVLRWLWWEFPQKLGFGDRPFYCFARPPFSQVNGLNLQSFLNLCPYITVEEWCYVV